MRAAELLTILLTNPRSQDYEGVFFEKNKQVLPFTAMDTSQAPDHILLYAETNQPILPLDEWIACLSEFRERILLFWDGEDWNPIYGVKEVDQKLIV
ncbi:MAG: hypothetical protein ACK5NA_03450 [Enterococcus sp.]